MKYIINFLNEANDVEIQSYLTALNADNIIELDNFEKVFIVDSISAPSDSPIIELIINDTETPITLLNIQHDFDTGSETRSFETNNPSNWWKMSSILSADFDSTNNSHTVRGEQVNVYVLDSGIESTHSEFSNISLENVHSFTSDFNDTTGHGTAISSVIAGNTCSLANPNLCIVKIFDSNVTTYQSDMLLAFDAVISHRELNNNPVAVMNLSWSIPKNQFIESKIQTMIDAGIFVVCSAGNSGIPIENVTPASMPDVLTIGSYNENLVPSDFSNYSNQPISTTQNVTNTGSLDGWAPGENIRAAGLNNTFITVNGTSIAAAIHTSAVAYNLFAFLGDDGNFTPCTISYAGNSEDALRISLSKENLLTIGAEYNGSTNKITTFVSDSSLTTASGGIHIKAKTGTTLCRRLFYPNVTSITLKNISELPYGLQISGRFLVGDVPEITGNAENSEIECEITLASGAIRQFFIHLHIIDSLIVEEDVVPGDDPALDIILQLAEC